MIAAPSSPLTHKFVDGLYTETLLLADEARTYFDDTSHAARDLLPPRPRVLFSCEALKVTSRLMACIAWLLSARTNRRGAVAPLGLVEVSNRAQIALLPDEARVLIIASQDLYARVARLEDRLCAPAIASPVNQLMLQLNAAF